MLKPLYRTEFPMLVMVIIGETTNTRKENDLTPINALGVPHEVKPLVDAINLHMERIGA
jgi:two-component system sensor histidine kinase TctE